MMRAIASRVFAAIALGLRIALWLSVVLLLLGANGVVIYIVGHFVVKFW